MTENQPKNAKIFHQPANSPNVDTIMLT